METRTCRYCDTEQSILNFEIAKTIGVKIYRRHKCDNCYREMKKERRRGIRNWMEDLKKTLKCNRCPVTDFRCLTFHHKDDNKLFDVAFASSVGYSRQRIMSEIAKCEVLCANCHRIHHYEERQGVAQ